LFFKACQKKTRVAERLQMYSNRVSGCFDG
jgi:hypothetical protein